MIDLIIYLFYFSPLEIIRKKKTHTHTETQRKVLQSANNIMGSQKTKQIIL